MEGQGREVKLAGELDSYDADYKVFLAKLKEARSLSGLRQADVAQRVGRAQSWVSKIESGELRVDFVELVHLARIYDRPLGFFEPPAKGN